MKNLHLTKKALVTRRQNFSDEQNLCSLLKQLCLNKNRKYRLGLRQNPRSTVNPSFCRTKCLPSSSKNAIAFVKSSNILNYYKNKRHFYFQFNKHFLLKPCIFNHFIKLYGNDSRRLLLQKSISIPKSLQPDSGDEVIELN